MVNREYYNVEVVLNDASKFELGTFELISFERDAPVKSFSVFIDNFMEKFSEEKLSD